MRTAVIYARFSCSKQREASIEDQLRVCREWCARNGYKIVAEYSDHGLSGTTDERPEFQRMISNAGESEACVVYMMDRFSRNIYDAPIYKKRLKDKGVRVVSATESMPDGPESILVESIYEAMAAMESAQTSRRTKRGMHGNALKCMANGVRTFGYMTGSDGRYEIDEPEAALVKEAFERRASGEAVNHIAADFRSRGVLTQTGKPCCYSMVYGMLRNRKYIGTYSFGGVEIPDGMPRIVSDELFRAAQGAPVRKDRGKEMWGTYALAGKAICEQCGRTMQGTSGRGRKGVKYEYYSCPGHDVKPVRKDWLESEIAKRIRAMLSDPAEALRVAQSLAKVADDGESNAKREHAEKALRAAETGISNLVHAMEMGAVSPEVTQRLAELREQKARAEYDLQSIEDGAFDVWKWAQFLQEGLSTMPDGKLLSAFVWNALVGPDDIVVTLNYDTEKSEPVQLEIERVRTDLTWLPG